MLKHAIDGAGHLHLGLSFGVLLAFSVLLFTLCAQNIKKRWIV